MDLIVDRKSEVADKIVLFEVKNSDDSVLPGFTPGAHVSVTGPTGIVRKYSLCNGPDETRRYRFAVKKEINGKGGSLALIDGVNVGDALTVSEPRNDFPMDQSASRFLFIAGGIGITPIYSMMQHLDARKVAYTLYYFTRTETAAAFKSELIAPREGSTIVIHHDEGDPAKAFDVGTLLAEHPEGMHLYCCGPRPLMDAVRTASSHWPRGTVHFENFGSDDVVSTSGNQPFSVHLVRSGITVDIPADKTIIEVLRERGFDVPTSCETGSCATCKVALLGGIADHRDLVLFDDELETFIIPCVSRAKTSEISIDL